MKARVKYKVIPYVVYPFDVMVSFHSTYMELEKELKSGLPEFCWDDISRFAATYEGKTVRFENGFTCMSISNIDHRTIAHEVFHAVEFLMEHIGIKLTYETDEVYAYVIGYLTDEIYKLVK